MRLASRALTVAALLAATMIPTAKGQTPSVTPAPAATPVPDASVMALPTPIAPTALRIRDAAAVAIAKLPPENPFGKTVDVPAALPAKLSFTDAVLPSGFFLSAHVSPSGKVFSVRRDHDPIPSLAAETLKSVSRWTFAPARRGGQPVDTWGAYRLELAVEIRSPKLAQMALAPVTPATKIPAPFDWPSDATWLEGRRSPSPADGSVAIEEVDMAPVPQKTPWSADSYKGPFSVKYWVKIDRAGKIERAIVLDVSDPVLLAYFRKAMSSWVLQPARSAGASVESWNELTLGGQISYSDEIKQISALRRNLGP